MANMALLEALGQIERSKKIERGVLIEALEAAMASASKKSYGPNVNIVVHFDAETGDFAAAAIKKVVEEVEDDEKEISFTEAKDTYDDLEIGDDVEVPLPPIDFGRIAAQTAKQVVVQRVREAEREQVYNDFKARQNDVVSCSVLRVEGRTVIVDLGDTEGVLPAKEQVRNEDYQAGDRMKVYLVDVRQTSRGPQIIVSRTHPNLVKRLFELEVPEIAEGIVEIKAVAREAGVRTKISVQSHDDKIDPVGSCVGMKGMRVQAVVNEILGEKIDIIPWNEVAIRFIESALSPARVSRVIINEEDHSAMVVVPEDQLSLAIGKKGQNVRLAAKISGWKVDIKTESKMAEEQLVAAQADFAEKAAGGSGVSLLEIAGVTAGVAEKLKAGGIKDVASLRALSLEELTEVDGIGEKTAEKLLEAAAAWRPAAPEPEEEAPEADEAASEETAAEEASAVETTAATDEEISEDNDEEKKNNEG